MKEDSSLKGNIDQESEIFKTGEQKEEVGAEHYSYCEIIMFVISLIFFICLVIFILFEDKIRIPGILNDDNKPKSLINKPEQKKEKTPVHHNLSEKKKQITCPEGFFMPTDGKGKRKCLKCTIDGCSKCDGTSKKNQCLSCMDNYLPIYGKRKKIKNCVKKCEEGDNEKCLTCGKDVCKSCNLGYKLENGKCLLNYSLKATFRTELKKENINLINKAYSSDIIELIIDGKKVPPSYNYTFNKNGEHNILMSLNTTNLVSGKMMFCNLTNLISINFTSEFQNISMMNMHGMFKDCINLKSIELSNLKTDKVKDFSFMFDNCKSLESIDLSQFNTKTALDTRYMFSNCKSVSQISLKSFDTSNVRDMTGLFDGCSSLESIDLSQFKTKNAKYMLYMFSGCSALKSIDISSFETSNVTDMSFMFRNCSSLEHIDVSKLDTQKVVNIDSMFMDCSLLQNIDLSNLNTKHIRSSNKLFYGCSQLNNVDFSSFLNSTWNQKVGLFNEKIAKTGEIKLSKKFKGNITIPLKWKRADIK